MPDSDQEIRKELFESIIKDPSQSTLVSDVSGTILYVNAGFEKYYSRSKEKAVGVPASKIDKNSQINYVLKTGKSKVSLVGSSTDEQILRLTTPLRKGKTITGAIERIISFPADDKDIQLPRQDINPKTNSASAWYGPEGSEPNCARYHFDDIIGQSDLIKDAIVMAERAAKTDSSVLIIGESGTGKELFAQGIHQSSKRCRGPFARLNCSSIPVELIESELFGYNPGAFTGAKKSGHVGKFEHAHNGTIFLDEIGDMPLNMQAKLLRVLQEKEITRIGSNTAINVDFRLISATHQNLPEMLENSTFRSDLFYRINVLTLKVPPLRRIKSDISLMVNYFLSKMGEVVEREVKDISDEALAILQNYHWPGNVRELRNAIERSYVVCRGSQIQAGDLPQNIINAQKRCAGTAGKIQSLKEILEEAEKKAILEALQLSRNEKKSAAEILGIHRTGLYQKIKKYGIDFST